LFILTGGGCGIWALVDLVNIITGNFDWLSFSYLDWKEIYYLLS
jgi:hypothetical protein